MIKPVWASRMILVAGSSNLGGFLCEEAWWSRRFELRGWFSLRETQTLADSCVKAWSSKDYDYKSLRLARVRVDPWGAGSCAQETRENPNSFDDDDVAEEMAYRGAIAHGVAADEESTTPGTYMGSRSGRRPHLMSSLSSPTAAAADAARGYYYSSSFSSSPAASGPVAELQNKLDSLDLSRGAPKQSSRSSKLSQVSTISKHSRTIHLLCTSAY